MLVDDRLSRISDKEIRLKIKCLARKITKMYVKLPNSDSGREYICNKLPYSKRYNTVFLCRLYHSSGTFIQFQKILMQALYLSIRIVLLMRD